MDWEKTIIDSLEWGKEISNREEKQKVADKIASMVKDGDIIGVGSGSTAYLALLKIADRIRTEQLHIHAIPPSQEIKMACAKLGIPLTSLREHKPNGTFASHKLSFGISAPTGLLTERTKSIPIII